MSQAKKQRFNKKIFGQCDDYLFPKNRTKKTACTIKKSWFFGLKNLLHNKKKINFFETKKKLYLKTIFLN